MVSDGTVTPDEIVDEGPDYLPEARVPAPHWLALPEHEFRELHSIPATAGRGTVIRVFTVPEDVIEPFHRPHTRDAAASWNGAGALREPGYDAAERDALPYMRSIADSPDDLSFLGREVRRPGQVTTTIDERMGKRVGMHLDSWDGWDPADLDARHRCRTRLSINLGQVPRYLLFMRIPRASIQRKEHEEMVALGPTRLLQSFLLSHPHLPVYRLAIRPGEAYIAPIEVMPHDSSTYGMREDDISLSAVGHFDPLACA
jgi:hypothetical protein